MTATPWLYIFLFILVYLVPSCCLIHHVLLHPILQLYIATWFTRTIHLYQSLHIALRIYTSLTFFYFHNKLCHSRPPPLDHFYWSPACDFFYTFVWGILIHHPSLLPVSPFMDKLIVLCLTPWYGNFWCRLVIVEALRHSIQLTLPYSIFILLMLPLMSVLLI